MADTLGEMRELSEAAKKAALKSLEYENECRKTKDTVEITALDIGSVADSVSDCITKAEAGVKAASELLREAREIQKSAAALVEKHLGNDDEILRRLEEFRREMEAAWAETSVSPGADARETGMNTGGRRPRMREDRRR
jgi:hypothetical protein